MELANEKGLHEVRIPPEDSINKANCFPVPSVQVRAQVIVFAVVKNITHRNAGGLEWLV